jgi:hypothetical protein
MSFGATWKSGKVGKPSAAPPWWWLPNRTCVAAYQAIGAASVEASRVNLANPGTHDLTPVSYYAGSAPPAWTAAKGWYRTRPNDQAWNTGITTAHSDWSYIARCANTVYSVHVGVLFGTVDGPGHNGVVGVCPRWTNIMGQLFGACWYNGTWGRYLLLDLTGGVFGVRGQRMFLDAQYMGDIGYPEPRTYPYPMYLMAFNDCNQGTIHGPYYGELHSFACYDSLLTDAEMAYISANQAALE